MLPSDRHRAHQNVAGGRGAGSRMMATLVPLVELGCASHCVAVELDTQSGPLEEPDLAAKSPIATIAAWSSANSVRARGSASQRVASPCVGFALAPHNDGCKSGSLGDRPSQGIRLQSVATHAIRRSLRPIRQSNCPSACSHSRRQRRCRWRPRRSPCRWAAIVKLAAEIR